MEDSCVSHAQVRSDDTMSVDGSVTSPCVDIVIRDVGNAVPRAAAVLAEIFGLPVEAMVATIYRAPARLAAGLEPEAAGRVLSCLDQLGLTLEVVPAGSPIDAGTSLDLAAEIVDPGQADAAAAVTAEFLGIPLADAFELLLAPPGVVLGNVSAATVAAFERRLPAGALSLTAADPATSRYALFAGDVGDADRAAIATLLDGATPAGDGFVALDLSHADAGQLWRQLARVPGVRLVNQAFLRFEIVLTRIAENGPATAAALEALAGVPSQAFEALGQVLPVVVEEQVPHADVEARLLAYAEHGMTVTARLANFAEQILVVEAAPPAARGMLGVDGAAPLPLSLPPLGTARARVLRWRLEAAGAEVRQYQQEAA
jgi:hypothetical protein